MITIIEIKTKKRLTKIILVIEKSVAEDNKVQLTNFNYLLLLSEYMYVHINIELIYMSVEVGSIQLSNKEMNIDKLKHLLLVPCR